MKAILEFDLPDDKDAYKIYNKAFDMHHILWELDQDLRSKVKYASDTDPDCKIDAYQEVRNKLHQLLNEHNIAL